MKKYEILADNKFSLLLKLISDKLAIGEYQQVKQMDIPSLVVAH